MKRGRALLAAAALLALGLLPGRSAAGTFEDAVRARWRGAWVVVETELYSSCAGAYEANVLEGRLVTGRGSYRFLPGELGKVERLQLRKKVVDLTITLDVPQLVSWQDGPFTLHDQRSCGVSLEIRLPREMTRARDVAAIDGLVAHVVRRFDTREAAAGSGLWNAREVEPYPADHELTLARHAAWSAQQLNLGLDRRREAALEQVTLTGRSIGDDPDYLQGLAAGVAAMKNWPLQDCPRLISSVFESARSAPPAERRGDEPADERWRRGFDDGQRLVYNITLLERLDRCYVPVPAVPEEG